jgi:hypothetical protein
MGGLLGSNIVTDHVDSGDCVLRGMQRSMAHGGMILVEKGLSYN